jgi:hypothetical protein
MRHAPGTMARKIIKPRAQQTGTESSAIVRPAVAATQRVSPEHKEKSEFIRSLPGTLPPREVMARAKAEGMTLSRSLIYDVRRRLKPSKTALTSRRDATSVAAARPASSGPLNLSPREKQLVDLVLDLGMARTHEILKDLRGALSRLGF